MKLMKRNFKIIGFADNKVTKTYGCYRDYGLFSLKGCSENNSEIIDLKIINRYKSPVLRGRNIRLFNKLLKVINEEYCLEEVIECKMGKRRNRVVIRRNTIHEKS